MTSDYETLLIENRIEWLKNNSRRINTSHEEGGGHYKDSKDIVDHFARNADPTNRKVYTQWIVNRYHRGGFRQKDAPRVKEALENFHRHKDNLDQRDINKYQSLADVEQIKPKQSKSDVKQEGSESIYESPTLSVRHLKSMDAACKYGANTRWCTTSRDPKENEFEDYDAKGPLHFVHNRPTNERYLVHLNTPLIHDESRKEYTPKELADKHPETKKVDKFRSHPHHGHAFKDDKMETRDGLDSVLTDKTAKLDHKYVNLKHPDVNGEILSRSIRKHQTHPTDYVYLYHLMNSRPRALRDEHLKNIRDYPYRHESAHQRLRNKANDILRDNDRES